MMMIMSQQPKKYLKSISNTMMQNSVFAKVVTAEDISANFNVLNPLYTKKASTKIATLRNKLSLTSSTMIKNIKNFKDHILVWTQATEKTILEEKVIKQRDLSQKIF